MKIKLSLWKVASLFTFSLAIAHGPQCQHRHVVPELHTRWADGGDTHYVRASYYKPSIFSIYSEQSVKDHLLPSAAISYRENPEMSLSGESLSGSIQNALLELQQKQPLSEFTVMKDKEFNYADMTGALIMKAKDHPFVVKLFFETPLTFLKPYEKGLQAAVMHRITGGVNRYLAGFTRIENMERIRDQLRTLDLGMEIDFPRKWYWLPQNPKYFQVSGYNFDGNSYSMTLPSTYAIVADYIQASKPMKEMRTKYRRAMFATCKHCDFELDPNTKNFKVEDSSGKFVVIDTEHFPTVVGQKVQARNYTSLYIQLGKAGLTKGFNNPKPRKLEPI